MTEEARIEAIPGEPLPVARWTIITMGLGIVAILAVLAGTQSVFYSIGARYTWRSANQLRSLSVASDEELVGGSYLRVPTTSPFGSASHGASLFGQDGFGFNVTRRSLGVSRFYWWFLIRNQSSPLPPPSTNPATTTAPAS